MSKTKIVFFGNERLATGINTKAPTLRALIESGYEIVAVVANFEAGISRNGRELEISSLAKENNIPVLLPNKPSDIIDQLKEYNAEAGILAAYGKIIPQSIIDIFPHGIINIHPSLLPQHRGPTPIESVIIGGETTTGVSIMKLVKEMDAGPVYGFSEFKLNGTEDKQSLADELQELGTTLLLNLLPGILSGEIVAQSQNEEHATYDKQITKTDGILDFNKPANLLEREIRAYMEWPKSRTKLSNIDVIITSAEVDDDSGKIGKIEILDNKLVIYCKEKSLSIKSLKPAGKNDMNIESFISGYGSRLKENN